MFSRNFYFIITAIIVFFVIYIVLINTLFFKISLVDFLLGNYFKQEVINYFSTFFVLITSGSLIYGVFKFRKAINDEEKIKAKKFIKWGAIGVFLSFILLARIEIKF